MIRYTLCILLVLSPVLSRNMLRFSDLDSEEQQLYRAAYDTPSYDQGEYETVDLEPGKLDLLKDGLWAIKAKIKELIAFDKALAASVLSTKLKLKELLEYHFAQKKPHIELVVEKKKPTYYSYTQAPPPSYSAPAPAYSAPQYQQEYAPAPAPPAYHHDPYYGH